MALLSPGLITTQKNVVSSTLTTSPVNIFETVGNGLLLEDCVVITDATGLAGATALVLKADGRTFFQTAVSGLGANAVQSVKTASVTGTKVVIPAGTKYITVEGTVGSGTGAGVATITLTFTKLDTNSNVNPL